MSYIYDLTDTWNAGATTFTAIKMSVTDTASASGSLLMDLQVGGSSRFNVRKDGLTTIGNNQSLNMGASGALIIGGTVLIQDGANNIFAQRNGTNAQAFRVYNTYTDASNYERLAIGITSNTFEMLAQNAGTGAARDFRIGTAGGGALIVRANGSDRWFFNSAGHFLASTDNTYDIGASGATRPRNIYAGSSMVTATAGAYYWLSRSAMLSPSDGVIGIYNNAWTDFGRLQFGGTTSSFPALKRSTTSLQARLADDSDFTNIQGKLTTETAYTAGAPTATGYIVLYDSTGTAYKVPAEAL